MESSDRYLQRWLPESTGLQVPKLFIESLWTPITQGEEPAGKEKLIYPLPWTAPPPFPNNKSTIKFILFLSLLKRF